MPSLNHPQSSSYILSIIHQHITIFFFFFNDTATTEIYTLSLHDALPICQEGLGGFLRARIGPHDGLEGEGRHARDRKSTRLNSSHGYISYAVFCLKKKKKTYTRRSHNIIKTRVTHLRFSVYHL